MTRAILAVLIYCLCLHVADARPKKITGTIEIKDQGFRFVSGGAGWSIPYGDWLITPNEVGPWGERHGAIGLNHDDDIPDPQLGRGREGIEIHAAHSDRTEGCVGILSGFDKFKKLVMDLIDETSSIWLHVGPNGAAITTEKDWDGEINVQVADEDEDTHPRYVRKHYARHHYKHYAHHYHHRHYAGL